MAKHSTVLITSSGAEVPEPATGMVQSPAGTTPQKRGFKPRWLRLQRRERKLREARAIAARTVIG
jgi:hypothetical protein